MKTKIQWLWIWLTTFLQHVWRKNDYYCCGKRIGIMSAGFIAKVTADTCIEIRKEQK